MLGSGTAEDPYQVATAEDLNDVRNDLTAYYLQVADIDLSEYENWEPIGINSGSEFAGFYDGDNYKITGLTINKSDVSYIGLFREAYYGIVNGEAVVTEIKNVNLVDVNVTGRNSVGPLVGEVYGCRITNCKSSGVINGRSLVGGLIGYHYAGYGDVMGDIVDSSSSCTINGSMDNYRNSFGGLVGGSEGNIRGSYATGDVSGNSYVGGLVGSYSSQTTVIEDCFSTGKVNGSDVVGGFVGGCFYSPIIHCYSIGNVAGDTKTGGFAGESLNGVFTSCYYDAETSGQYDTGKGIPKTTTEMKTQATFSGWDFQTVWAIDSGYPYLQWSKTVYPLQTGKDYVYVIPFPGGTMNFGGKEYKFVDFLERFPKEQHLAAGVSRDYKYGGPLVKYGEQTYGFLASGITDPAAEGGFGTYLPDTKRTVLSLTDRENFVNFYYIYPALPEVEKPVWVKKVITWKDVAGAAAYEVKLFLDTEEQCIDTQLVGPGVQRFDFTYFIESFMPAGNYLCTVQALAAEVTRKAIVWVDTPGATSYTVNLYNSDGEIVYTDSVAPGVQTYDFTAVIPTLPTGTNYYGVAIPVIPA